ncbi:carboxypeptidase-like regulatory domain-containing protein [Halococcus sediminicola]|uniref:carboxypeptidase-like regulatory domain-containing protein n=1 Tax=Halococcus sediminicola TaxID=1264579 RepID=UPI000678E7D2|nr:carboxypeptidase-like regulatory domain-containing protein [Halococcus sediminicola]
MNTRLTLAILLACLVLVPTTAAAAEISGTVTTDNGSTDGANVTIAAVSENFTAVGDPVRTSVSGSSFEAEVPDAPVHVVRVARGGATHYAVLREDNSTTIALNSSITGRVIDDNGEGRANTTVELVDESGFAVDRALTGDNGRFVFDPVESNESYQLRVSADGVPYQETVNTTVGERNVTVTTPAPTDDISVLSVANRSPAGHVLQVLAPQNESGVPSIVETISLRNMGERPFVGTVSINVPADAQPYSGMVDGETAQYRRAEGSVRLNLTVPANGTTQAGVAYDLRNRSFEKTLQRNTTRLAVVMQDYNVSAVGHSENLRVGNASISLLTNDEPLRANDTISVNLSGARAEGPHMDLGTPSAANANASAPSESSSLTPFPTVPVFGGLAMVVVGGLIAYRVF